MPNPMRQKAIEGLKTLDRFRYQRTFTRKETQQFGDLTRDYNPVHYDSRWAASKGFADLICHGLLIGSMVCEFGGQVGWLATGMEFKFLKPVYFGDTITFDVAITRIEPTGRAEAQGTFTNQSGLRVGKVRLTGRLPSGLERELLRKMVNEGDPSNKLGQENNLKEET